MPYFGICFGMQMAVIEAARNLADIPDARFDGIRPDRRAGVGLMTEWMKGNELEKREANGDLGGTMRLGAYKAQLAKGSRVAEIYGSTEISERHRHRYEVNMRYRNKLEAAGLRFSGVSPRRTAAGNCRDPGASLVRGRTVSSRAQVPALRTASLVRIVHRSRGRTEQARLTHCL